MIFRGKTVSEGIAVGHIKIYRKRESSVSRRVIDDTEAEIARFERAKESAKREIGEIYEKALAELGEKGAAIFEAHQMLLDDPDFAGAVTGRIEQEKVNAECAVEAACEQFSSMFHAMDQEYMQARAADVEDIGSRLIANLKRMAQAAYDDKETASTGESVETQAAHDDKETAATGESVEAQAAHDNGRAAAAVTERNAEEPIILVADELSPSETIRLGKSGLLAIVTRRGSVHSHMAILARTLGLPALTGVKFDVENNGRLESDGCMGHDGRTVSGADIESGTPTGIHALNLLDGKTEPGRDMKLDGHVGIVDGYDGLFLVDPDETVLAEYRTKQKDAMGQAQFLAELRDQETVTKDGRRIRLCANIGGVEDAEAALQNGADGIGLFRTEFLYLGASGFPTEEQQFEAYRAVVEKMDGRKVIIRTFDLGSDKCPDYFPPQSETNPALGYRGIRICLDRPDVFRTQLRAILRASYYGKAAVMYPMIISVDEVRRAKQMVDEVRAELRGQNIPYGEPEQGIMIETPAAVWLSEELSKEVDFFSIGTNDLTQYMLAVDRQNQRLDVFYDPYHPAVLGAVRTVVENAHKAGIWAGICGELAADTSLTEEFLRMGVDELSVAPAHILAVRAAVRSVGDEDADKVRQQN